MTDEHRVKIKNSNILNALIEHVEGKRDGCDTGQRRSPGLFRKVMPTAALQIPATPENFYL